MIPETCFKCVIPCLFEPINQSIQPKGMFQSLCVFFFISMKLPSSLSPKRMKSIKKKTFFQIGLNVFTGMKKKGKIN